MPDVHDRQERRRVLEKNGFELAAVRPVATEPSDTPMAIYRLQAAATTPMTSWASAGRNAVGELVTPEYDALPVRPRVQPD